MIQHLPSGILGMLAPNSSLVHCSYSRFVFLTGCTPAPVIFCLDEGLHRVAILPFQVMGKEIIP